jgi:hypothetical protein
MNNFFVKTNNNGNDITEYLPNLPLVVKGGVYIEKHLLIQKGLVIGNSELTIPGILRYNCDSLQIYDGDEYRNIWTKFVDEKPEWILNDKNDMYFLEGKVGINTRNPRKTLDVNGDIYCKNLEANNGYFKSGIIIGGGDSRDIEGMIKYENGVFFGYNGNNWTPFNNEIINPEIYVNKIETMGDFSKIPDIKLNFNNDLINFNCPINLNHFSIKNIGAPTDDADAVNKKYVDNLVNKRKFLGIVRSIIEMGPIKIGPIEIELLEKYGDLYDENDRILYNGRIYMKIENKMTMTMDFLNMDYEELYVINAGFIIPDLENWMLKEGEYIKINDRTQKWIKNNMNVEMGLYGEINLLDNKLTNDLRKCREEFNYNLKYKIDEIILDDFFIKQLSTKMAPNLTLSWNNIYDVKIRAEHILDEQIYSQHIGKFEIDSYHIKPQVINGEHLMYECIEEHHLNELIIDQKHLKRNIITNEYLTDNCIEERNIKDRIISSRMIKMNSIGEENLMTNIIGGNHIKNGSITENKIMNNSISMLKIQDFSITEKKIHPGIITAEHIKDKGITNEKLKMPYLMLKMDGEIFEYAKMLKLGYENEIKIREDVLKIKDGKIIIGRDVVIEGDFENKIIQKLLDKIEKLENMITKIITK